MAAAILASQFFHEKQRQAVANSIQQMLEAVTGEVSFSDLQVAFEHLSVAKDTRPPHLQAEPLVEPADIAARRKTCANLATICAELAAENGDIPGDYELATSIWEQWSNAARKEAIEQSNDGRLATMAQTALREFLEVNRHAANIAVV